MFDEVENPKIPVKNSRAGLRSTESQPTCNCKSRRPVNVCRPPNPLPNPPPSSKEYSAGHSHMGIAVFLCLSSTPVSTTTALSVFFLVDFAFVFKANSVDFKIKLLSWKECAAQCSLPRCPWRFIHCRRRLVSH